MLNVHELEVTPNRKRKRDSEINLCEGLTNAGFCSTPKREIISSAFVKTRPSRAVYNDLNLEVKEITEVAKVQGIVSDNPYEVVRRPPKKKKKEDACFVNPALSLELPEKHINPFEVRRSVSDKTDRNCFVNSVLNIRTEEANLAVNPFEIQRRKIINQNRLGIENPALKVTSNLRIGVPFQPTVGCRIDFTGLNLRSPESNTPSKLLAEKLVLCPDINVSVKLSQKNRSLSAISEETVDIGKELDYYQLELENSINEAKIRKKCFDQRQKEVEESTHIAKENSLNLPNAANILNISSAKGNEDKDSRYVHANQKDAENKLKVHIDTTTFTLPEHQNTSLEMCDENHSEDENPVPFVRSYRKTEAQIPIRPTSPQLEHINFQSHGKRGNFVNDIRKSFRKAMQSSKGNSDTKQPLKEHQSGIKFFETVRQSLRRSYRTKSKIVENGEGKNNTDSNDVSVLGIPKRKVFRSPNAAASKPFERDTTVRSSLRKTSKSIKNQVLKSVFHKNLKEYELK